MGDKYRHSVTSCYLSSRRGFLGSPRGELSTQLTEGRQNNNITGDHWLTLEVDIKLSDVDKATNCLCPNYRTFDTYFYKIPTKIFFSIEKCFILVYNKIK